MYTDTDTDKAIDLLEDISHAVDYAIVGPKDNRIHEIRTTLFPFNTVCHLERDFGDGVWRGCTGTLIGPTTVLSAGHCLYNHRIRRAPVRIRVSPGRSDRNTMPFGSIIASKSYVPLSYINARNPLHPGRRNFDYGVTILPRAFKGINRFMTPSVFSDAEMERIKHARLVTIAGYPADRPIGTLWRHSERIKSVTPSRLMYTVDTCPGHSGSPIWFFCPKTGERYIIGVHTSGPIDETGRAYGCSRGTVYAPAGMMNGGVRITPSVFNDIVRPDRTGRMQAIL